MKPGEEDTKAAELVLIRRRGGGEESHHHGGVWKIAYADFMTAMMAFFLVMWLINSTDQKVLTQVANYFNPMRLTDNTPREKGLQDLESGDQGKQGKESMPVEVKEKKKAKPKVQERIPETNAPGEENKEGKQSGVSEKAKFTEQALFSDPYGVLSRLAADAPAVESSAKTPAAAADPYRDPFEPAQKRDAATAQEPPAKAADRATQSAKAKPPAAQSTTDAQAKDKESDQASTPAGIKIPFPAERAGPPAKADAVPADTIADAQARPLDLPQPPAKSGISDDTSAKEAAQAMERAAVKAAIEKAAATAEAASIAADLKEMLGRLKGTVPNIDVTITEEGILISLTDDTDFGMFAIASAEPRPAMVVIMERVAKIVQSHPYPLIVRGHTDGRPYRSGTYDNWRLSTARAHMAYYMLVRGGVEERRFERVEGHADRSLRVPSDPDAAQNRRIEILLRRPRS